MKIEEKFVKNLAQIGVDLTASQIHLFMVYCEELKKASQLYNLTSIKDDDGIYNKHFLDSISLLEWLELKNKSLLDIGTGAGFPGVPLNIVVSDLDVVLLDSNRKKIEFLDHLIEVLNLTNIKTKYSRVEEYQPEKLFDVVTSRAVAKLSVLFELSYPKVKIGGEIVAYKGDNYEEELKGSELLFKKLGITHKIFKATLDDFNHHLIVLKKNSSQVLNRRNYSQIVKNPLW
jgi:16S rRNA (guanine527-N7)-methyltransferase